MPPSKSHAGVAAVVQGHRIGDPAANGPLTSEQMRTLFRTPELGSAPATPDLVPKIGYKPNLRALLDADLDDTLGL